MDFHSEKSRQSNLHSATSLIHIPQRQNVGWHIFALFPKEINHAKKNPADFHVFLNLTCYVFFFSQNHQPLDLSVLPIIWG